MEEIHNCIFSSVLNYVHTFTILASPSARCVQAGAPGGHVVGYPLHWHPVPLSLPVPAGPGPGKIDGGSPLLDTRCNSSSLALKREASNETHDTDIGVRH